MILNPFQLFEELEYHWNYYAVVLNLFDPFTLLQVTPRLQELQLFRLQQESKNSVAATGEKETSSKKNAREKRKAMSSPIDEQSPTKRQKDTDQNVKKTNKNDKGQDKHPAETTRVQLDSNKAETSVSKEKIDMSSKKPRSFNDKCTAFLSNLNFEACSLFYCLFATLLNHDEIQFC